MKVHNSIQHFCIAMVFLMIILGALNKAGFFKKEPPTHTSSQIVSSEGFSKAQNYIDSLEKREEVVMLDTAITHFGRHPGHLEYDTTYTVSYKTRSAVNAKNVLVAAKKSLREK